MPYDSKEDELILWATQQTEFQYQDGSPIWKNIAVYINTTMNKKRGHRKGKDIHQRFTRVLKAAKPMQAWTCKGLLKLYHAVQLDKNFGHIRDKYFQNHSDAQLRYQFRKHITDDMKRAYEQMTVEEKTALLTYIEPFKERKRSSSYRMKRRRKTRKETEEDFEFIDEDELDW